MSRQYHKPEILKLGATSGWGETFVQETIASDPSILGLGDVVVRDKERQQIRGGRLDFLLQNPEGDSRYELEVQLGPTDESHIIRTIEYWDVERKRFPQFEHTAVIVAEEITSRFFNVISLFNQSIPLIAIKITGLQLGDKSTLLFTKVLDYLPRGDEEENEYQEADRPYWEQRTSLETMVSVDKLFSIAKEIVPSVILKFNKGYIVIKLGGRHQRLISLWPQKRAIKMSVHIQQNQDMEKKLEAVGIDYEGYDERRQRYVLRLLPADITTHKDLLRDVISQIYKQNEMSNLSLVSVDE